MAYLGTTEAASGFSMGCGSGLAEVDLVEQVEDALLDEDQVQSHLIQVLRDEGVIYLRGRATDARAREAATRAAARVPGVQAVVNELEVRPRV